MNSVPLEIMYNIINTFMPMEVQYDVRTGNFTIELSAVDSPVELEGKILYFVRFTGTMKQGMIKTYLTQKEEAISAEITIPMIEKTDRTPIYEILRDSVQSAYNYSLI